MFDAIRVSALKEADKELSRKIKRETNAREKSRMTDEQGAIRFVIRTFPAERVLPRHAPTLPSAQQAEIIASRADALRWGS